MRIFKLANISFLLMLASAQSVSAGGEWKEEPNSFRGVEFNKPLTEQFHECPKDRRGNYEFLPKEQCFETDWKPNPYANGAVIAQVFNLRDIGIGDNSTNVHLIDGKVVQVHVNFAEYHFEQLYGALKERFGTPSEEMQMQLQNGLGTRFTGVGASWTGKTVNMTILQYAGTVDRSDFRVSTLAYLALGKADRQQEQNAIKNNL